MRKLRRIYGSFLTVMLLSILFGSRVFANESSFILEESERLGSITIRLEDVKKNLSKENVHMTIVKVADVVNGQFVLLEEYEDLGIDLNSIHNANDLGKTAKILEKNITKGETIVTNRNGVAGISNLTVGVYLVYASDTAEYEDILPALVSIPSWNEIDSSMMYDVVMVPKHMPVPEIPKTGVQDHAVMYLVAAAGAFIIAGICFVIKYKTAGRTLQKK